MPSRAKDGRTLVGSHSAPLIPPQDPLEEAISLDSGPRQLLPPAVSAAPATKWFKSHHRFPQLTLSSAAYKSQPQPTQAGRLAGLGDQELVGLCKDLGHRLLPC